MVNQTVDVITEKYSLKKDIDSKRKRLHNLHRVEYRRGDNWINLTDELEAFLGIEFNEQYMKGFMQGMRGSFPGLTYEPVIATITETLGCDQGRVFGLEKARISERGIELLTLEKDEIAYRYNEKEKAWWISPMNIRHYRGVPHWNHEKEFLKIWQPIYTLEHVLIDFTSKKRRTLESVEYCRSDLCKTHKGGYERAKKLFNSFETYSEVIQSRISVESFEKLNEIIKNLNKEGL
jgi:hypothetical protein